MFHRQNKTLMRLGVVSIELFMQNSQKSITGAQIVFSDILTGSCDFKKKILFFLPLPH
ncbi:MAG: hypothetical protein WC777_05595 [Candidatus Gracilibacteria bacterium]